jgi:hypothetical protein
VLTTSGVQQLKVMEMGKPLGIPLLMHTARSASGAPIFRMSGSPSGRCKA